MKTAQVAAILAGALALQALDATTALAQLRDRGGGRTGGGGAVAADRQVRRDASASVGRGAAAGAGGNRNLGGANVDRGAVAAGNRNVNVNNVNRNVTVNSNRNVNVGGDNDWDDDYHPGRGLAVVAGTALVVGAVTRSIPPSCSTVVVNGASYSQCGATWYQPRYAGSSVEYVVVNPPQ